MLVVLVVGHVERRRVARCSDVATRGGGGATHRPSLGTCHPDGEPVLLEKDAAAVAKLLFVRLINKGLKIVVCHRAFFQSVLTSVLAFSVTSNPLVSHVFSSWPHQGFTVQFGDMKLVIFGWLTLGVQYARWFLDSTTHTEFCRYT